MNIFEALRQRKSVRAFLNKEVEKEKIITILNFAKYAPSSANTQPWLVCVVSHTTKSTIESKILDAFDNDVKANMDYTYYPTNWKEPYKNRRKEAGLFMYQSLNITKEDKEAQRKQWKANYRAFDAPIVLYFFIDSSLEKGSYIDYGIFLQSIMLCAIELGLGCCTQAALAEYPTIVKQVLNIDKDKILLCAMALGYEDKNETVNNYRTSRIDLEEFVQFYT